MRTNATITIFNKRPDLQTRKVFYFPHKIEDVWFYCSRKTEIQQGALVSANEYKIRIPFPQQDWVPPSSYQTFAGIVREWTVQDDDFFILGEWDKSFVEGISQVKKEFSGVVGMVLNHTENFIGTSPHIRIGGGD
ncbi:MAG TPA: hypothetical protein IAA44_00665 [Candidatus Blautia avistercoris]|nr:hypothetical protein [Candidatus Blautia avistercoris]